MNITKSYGGKWINVPDWQTKMYIFFIYILYSLVTLVFLYKAYSLPL